MIFKLNFTERDTERYDKWISFYPKMDYQTPFKIQLDSWGYFDPRPQFNFNVTSILAVVLPFFSWWFLPFTLLFLFVGWGKVFLNLPLDTGKGNECENPSYGINTYTNSGIIDQLWLYWGEKRKHADLPWALKWHRTSILLKDGTWAHEYKRDRKKFYNDEWKERQWSEDYIYTYTTKWDDVQKVNTTIYVDEREWRRNWLPFTKLFNKIYKSIDVHFKEEVGEERGSWKGGVLVCGYTIKKGETPLDCLKRMELERRFS